MDKEPSFAAADSPEHSPAELPAAGPRFRAFIVHGYADIRRDRLYFTGRLEDGRSFAAVEENWRPAFHVYAGDLPRCKSLFSSLGFEAAPSSLQAFSGKEALARLSFTKYRDRSAALKLLEQAGIPSPDGDIKPAEAFLSERLIRGPAEIRGNFRRGRLVDLVFPGPELAPLEEAAEIPLKIASVDIETNIRTGAILALGIAWAGSGSLSGGEAAGLVRVLAADMAVADETAVPAADTAAPDGADASSRPNLFFHPDEPSLLKAFIADLGALDPDVITGWNFLDFDFPRLAERCARFRIPFMLGRSADEAKYFPGSSPLAGRSGRRSAAALVPGRQVIDALRIVRSGPKRFDEGAAGYTLEAVARAVLGEGKLVASSGDEKIAELEKLYQDDPGQFGRYCLKDAALVLRILGKTGLFRLTMERASLTGVSLDKAWTSVISFERIYGMELFRRGIAPPPAAGDAPVSGAAGGTVLESLPGVFNNVAVFDFRSLYPTIMRTFNIDPLAHARAGAASDTAAPNGAAFSRAPGILPELIAAYFAARRRALDAGNETAAHVYKILMNSFYGVLGTAACRYGRTALAGAITSFAKKWLLLSRDWFTRRGCRVLYGDTDSLFVETSLGDGAAYGDFLAWGENLAGELNTFLSETIGAEYGLRSYIEMRFEKAYRRFMIPPLRNVHDSRAGEGLRTDVSRGRAKGYGGYLLDTAGGGKVEVKGMEAVRSDATPLARRLQMELLELVFAGGGEAEFKSRVLSTLKDLKQGRLDGELVYRKRLTRAPESYTASTPPQVKAARLLGWKNRRGTVEFVWTRNGPEPAALPHGPFDYDHYTWSQVMPVALSIADAAGWSFPFPRRGRNRGSGRDGFESGQLELDL